MSRLFATTTAAAGLMLGCAIAAPAQAQHKKITPYIEVGQVLTADLQDSDVLTYSTVAAGIDAHIETRRVQVQLAYKYEHRFDYQGDVADSDIHSGIARVQVRPARILSLEAGAMATRARSSSSGAIPVTGVGNVSNSAQIYSAYAGPNLSTNIGPIFANSAYRFGYTKAEAPSIPSTVPGAPALDVYDSSKVQVATASVGVKSGTLLPVGVTASGSWTKEDAGQLDQRFDGKYARGDVVLPITRSVAIQGGVGYEKINITQRDPLLDPVTNAPVVDAAGRQQVDPASAPRLVYDLDGIFWDAGVIWRPSRRTFLEARVGKRYGSMSYTGSLSYQIGPQSGIQIGVYDSIESYGRQISGNLATLPTGFVTTADPFGNQYSGCILGTSGAAAGTCMSGVLASATTANYRARGVTAVAVLARGPVRLGFGGSYQRRDFIAPTTGIGTGISVNGTSDESYYIQAFASQELGRNAAISGNIFGSYFTSDLNPDGIYGWGANAMYSHRFGKLSGTAAVGLFGSEDGAGDKITAAQALLGLRYGF